MWDEVAERYHSWSLNHRSFYYLLGLEIKRSIGEPKSILDVGAGPGILAEELKNLFPNAEIVCLDSSPKMCKISRGIRGKAEFLPFKGEYFDLIIFCFSLHELEIQSALNEANRVLKKGGWILIVDLNRDAPDSIKIFWKTLLSKIICPKYAENLDKMWRTFERCEEIAGRLRKLNFYVECVKNSYKFKILAKKI